MSKGIIFDVSTNTETIVDVPDVVGPEPSMPPTDSQVIDDLIDLLIAQGVINNV